MTDTDLKALLEAATPGPWRVEPDPCHYDTMSDVVAGETREKPYPANRMHVSVGGYAGPKEQEANAALIALAPSLAARVLELEAENKKLAGRLKLLEHAAKEAGFFTAFVGELKGGDA
jgi:hypothetical protein